MPPNGSTVGIPGPFDPVTGVFGDEPLQGPYFPMSWSCDGEGWELFFDSNTTRMGWPAGIVDSVSQQFSPYWREPLRLRGTRDALPDTGTITGRFECRTGDAGIISIPFSTTVTYAEGPAGVTPPPGGGGGSGTPGGAGMPGGPGTPPDPATAERIRVLKAGLEELKQQRREMERAIEELKVSNDVFCGTAASLSMLRGLHAFQWNGVRVGTKDLVGELADPGLCDWIPDLVEAYVDADRKLERNAELIRKLEQEIANLEAGRVAAVSRSPARASAARLRVASRAAKPGGPLAKLKSRRTESLRTLGALSSAIANREFELAKRLARAGSSQLAALPAACSETKRYLEKSGIATRFTRSRILRALRRLKADPLPRSAIAFAKRFHLTRAQMRKLIRRAKKVPKSQIKATSITDLVCSPRVDAIDRSFADTLGKLAERL